MIVLCYFFLGPPRVGPLRGGQKTLNLSLIEGLHYSPLILAVGFILKFVSYLTFLINFKTTFHDVNANSYIWWSRVCCHRNFSLKRKNNAIFGQMQIGPNGLNV